MRSPFLAALGISTAAAMAVVGFAGTATAHNTGPAATHKGAVAQHVTPAKRGNCYSNMKQDSGVGVVSMTFEDSGFSIYDAYGADNFAVKKKCNVTGIDVAGQYFNGSGPADSETITFYSDNGGSPGTQINSQTVTGADSGGSFVIPLSTVTVPKGAAWVSASVNMYFADGGEWGWELSNHVKKGISAMWENPGGGFGVGCTSWSSLDTCLGYPGDFMFTLTK